MVKLIAKCPTEDILKRISWMIGKWRSIRAKISYPLMDSVDYTDELEIIAHGSCPTLTYSSLAKHAYNYNILHHETGFFRLKEDSDEVFLSYAQNKGLICIESGRFHKSEKKLCIQSTNIAQIPIAENLIITGIRRWYKLNGKRLQLNLFVETPETPLTEYLNVTYEKYLCQD